MTRTDEKCSQISWEIHTRSTWQSLLCFALLSWCWRHAACIPLGTDLRAQDTCSQVTSHSVVASCRRIQPFRVFGFFELFQLLSAHQMTPAGVIPHSSPPAGIIRHSCTRASEVQFFFHFFEVFVYWASSCHPGGPHSSSCMFVGRASQSSQGREPTGPEIIVAHLYSELWVRSDNMTSSHCHCHMVPVHCSSHVAEAGTGEPPLEGSFVSQSAEIPGWLGGHARQWRVDMSMPGRCCVFVCSIKRRIDGLMRLGACRFSTVQIPCVLPHTSHCGACDLSYGKLVVSAVVELMTTVPPQLAENICDGDAPRLKLIPRRLGFGSDCLVSAYARRTMVKQRADHHHWIASSQRSCYGHHRSSWRVEARMPLRVSFS